MRTMIRLLPLLLMPSMIEAQRAEHSSEIHAKAGEQRIILQMDGSTIELESVVGRFKMKDVLGQTEGAERVHSKQLSTDGSGPSSVRVVAPWRGGESSLLRWRQQAVSDQQRARRSVSIGFLKKDGSGQCFILSDAWPSEWAGPPLTGATSRFASELLEIRFDRLTSQDTPCARS